jgi:hypothetical protein
MATIKTRKTMEAGRVGNIGTLICLTVANAGSEPWHRAGQIAPSAPNPSHDIQVAPTSVLERLSRTDMEAEFQKTLHELGKKPRVTPSIMTDVTPEQPPPRRPQDRTNVGSGSVMSRSCAKREGTSSSITSTMPSTTAVRRCG